MAVAPDGSAAAVREAAALAGRVDHPLHVLHVVELAADADLAISGGHVLRAAMVLARGEVDGLGVTSELAHGDVIGRIVASARNASYVVLRQAAQPDARGRRAEVGPQVAARVGIPVVCVPRRWTRPRGPGTVTVAVKDPVTCGPLLQKGAAAAASIGAGLRVVHLVARHQQAGASLVLADRLARLPVPSGGSAAQLDVTEGNPVAELRNAARSSLLLVVGRHHRHQPGGSTLGPVAQALARRAACPVLLADPRHSASSGEWVFQTEWA